MHEHRRLARYQMERKCGVKVIGMLQGADVKACQLLEGSIALRGPLESSPSLGQIVQGSSNGRKVAHKSPVVTSKTAEGAHFYHISGSGPCSDGSNFGWVTLDASTTNDMTKERNLPLEETTLRRFQLQSTATELDETLSQGLLAKLTCSREIFRCFGAVYLSSNQMPE